MSDIPFDVRYRELYPNYKLFASRVAALMTDLLDAEHIEVSQVEHRAKTPDSVSGKIARYNILDPLRQISDLAGIRVVTFYNDDVERVTAIIRSEFAVDEESSGDKVNELQVEQFGYRSFHLVCTHSPARQTLREWRQFSEMRLEIQVRSVLQHAWAAISHKLDYKSVQQAPAQIRRKLFRLSALLEIADDEFAAIRDRTTGIVEQYKQSLEQGELDIPLDRASLAEYVRDRLDRGAWHRVAESAGCAPADLLPDEEAWTIDILLELLVQMGVQSIQEVDRLIRQHVQTAPVTIRRLVEAGNERTFVFEGYDLDLIVAVLTLGEWKRLPADHSYPTAYVQTVRDIIDVELQALRRRDA